MSAYVIFYVKNVTDPAGLAEYKRLAGPTLKSFGGEFRVLRGEFEVLEGDPVMSVIMLEFPSMAAARSWYGSPAYQAALKHRLAAANCQGILCESLSASERAL